MKTHGIKTLGAFFFVGFLSFSAFAQEPNYTAATSLQPPTTFEVAVKVNIKLKDVCALECKDRSCACKVNGDSLVEFGCSSSASLEDCAKEHKEQCREQCARNCNG